jgi:serine O-acetyltransferase
MSETQDQFSGSWSSIGSNQIELAQIVDELRATRERWRKAHERHREFGGREFPSRPLLRKILDDLCAALFPMRLGPSNLRQANEDYYVGYTLDSALSRLQEQVRLDLSYKLHEDSSNSSSQIDAQAAELVRRFARALPSIREMLDSDVEAAYHGDPAARSVDEVLLCYPGIVAITFHRIAHQLYRLGVPLVARIIAEISHSETGIDIHPGATIGKRFFIDHGTGVVIGETSVIGERVRIYQNVTLGAKRFPTGENGSLKKGLPRHPLIEDDVVIYAGATLLGRIAVGKGSIIGGNVWLTESVPAASHLTQASSQQSAQRPIADGVDRSSLRRA